MVVLVWALKLFILLAACFVAFACFIEKDGVLMDLQNQVKLLTQKEAAFSKQQKAQEAQVSTLLKHCLPAHPCWRHCQPLQALLSAHSSHVC
jgi:hypothetical protein